jgi:transposase-like protein
MGRPRKPPRPRPPRWTGWRAEYARKIYHAIRSGRVDKPTHPAIAAELGVHVNTIPNWLKKHPTLERAIERGLEDRYLTERAFRQARRVRYDPSTIDWDAKSPRGVFRKAVAVEQRFDHALFERETAHLHMRKHRWQDSHVEVVGHIIGDRGPLSNRALCRHFDVAESTLRNWRRRYPEFDTAIRKAIAAYRHRPKPSTPRPKPQKAVAPTPRTLAAVLVARNAPRPALARREPSTPRPKRLFAGIYADDVDQRL